MNTREQILSCVKTFEQNNDSITIKKVADKCGISHSLIYNRHPDLKEMINILKQKQKKHALVEQQRNQTENLLKRNKLLERKLASVKSKNDKETIAMLMAHISELYSIYDSLLDERNIFAKRIIDLEESSK
jgi:Mn-dependent DtxR family transcriptional regulator